MSLSGFAIVGRPFALWPATLQVMPEGLLDAAFGKFFVGVRLSNTSTSAWPATEVRISARGRRILSNAGIAISDGWSSGDASAVGQNSTSEWVPVPSLAVAPAFQTVFFKLDTTVATVGMHVLELEIRDPSAPQVTLKAQCGLSIARTTISGPRQPFTSVCDQGTVAVSLDALTIDQQSFRSLLGRVRALTISAPQGTRTLAETERLRLRLKSLLCGQERDVCSVLADLNTTCALPTPPAPGPTPATGLSAAAVFSDQATTIADRVRISDGTVWSNHAVTFGNDGNVNANVVSGGDVQIGDRTHIQGNVSAAGLIKMTPTGGATISGSQSEHAPFASISIPTKTVSAGTSPFTVNSGQGTLASPIPIAPGNYSTVTLNSNCVVAFAAGTYQIGTLIINADVTLILNQTTTPSDVRVVTNLSFGDRLIVKPGTTPAGVVAQFYSSQTTEVRVGTDIASFPVALTVPAGTIHVYSRTTVTGSLAAKTVTFEPDVIVSRVPVDPVVGAGTSTLELLAYPTAVQYSVAYKDGYFGSTGPLAFAQMPWKALLASAVVQFELGLPASVSADLLAMADQAVVGNVKSATLNAPSTAPTSTPPSSQAGSVDAAVASLRGNRALGSPLFSYLDAAPGEANATTMGAAGTITTPGTYLTNADIDALIANPSTHGGLAMYKSGAGTGVTRGILSGLTPVLQRDDETGTLYFINQLVIVPDPNASPPPADGKVSGFGDSGAIWLQVGTNKILGLGHSVASGGAVVTRIQDVINALQIQFA